jgi:hypothetical protein
MQAISNVSTLKDIQLALAAGKATPEFAIAILEARLKRTPADSAKAKRTAIAIKRIAKGESVDYESCFKLTAVKSAKPAKPAKPAKVDPLEARVAALETGINAILSILQASK